MGISRANSRVLGIGPTSKHASGRIMSFEDLNIPDEDFVSGCLLLRDCARGSVDQIKKRLSTNPSLLSFKDYDHRTALHVSASEGHLHVVQMLLEMGANPNQSDRWGGSPLDDAQRQRFPKVASLLRQSGGRLGVTDRGGALIMAASRGALIEVRELIEDGANPNCADYDNRTPLHLAASEGHPEVVKVLVDLGAHVNCEDRWGGTPLDDAQRKGNKMCVEMLESFGAVSKTWGSGSFAVSSKGPDTMEVDWKDVTVLEKIGSGAFGEIFKCRWRGTLVAAKKIKSKDLLASGHAAALSDFRSEIELLTNLRHPNICLLLGYSLTAKHEVMISELMKCSLLDVMKAFAGTPFALERSLRYAIHFAQGMTYLHSCKPPILHRDLKPANLLLDFSDTLKVSDFGLAKLRHARPKKTSGQNETKEQTDGEDTDNEAYQMTGETGSYRYMAPEVYRHEEYGRPVDVYSFSMIFFYMLVGSPPWEEIDGKRAVELAANNERPTIPRHIPIELLNLLKVGWADEPRSRPSFEAVLEKLNKFFLDEFKMTLEERMSKKATPQSSFCTVL